MITGILLFALILFTLIEHGLRVKDVQGKSSLYKHEVVKLKMAMLHMQVLVTCMCMYVCKATVSSIYSRNNFD